MTHTETQSASQSPVEIARCMTKDLMGNEAPSKQWLRDLLSLLTRQQEEIEARDKFIGKIKAAFVVNGLRAGHSRDEIDATLAALQAKPRCHCKGICEAEGRECPNAQAKPDQQVQELHTFDEVKP